MARSIIWRRWRCPLTPLVEGYQPDTDEHDVELHRALATFGRSWEGVPDDEAEEDSKQVQTGPCLISPLGVVPLHESNLPLKLFNFWMGDTDFDLTRRLMKCIAQVPGVETLDVFTRYRFRLGIGRAFQQDEVKRAIEEAVR